MSRTIITRSRDFRQYMGEKLPGVSALLYGIARQSELEVETGHNSMAEDMLLQAFTAFREPLLLASSHLGRKPRLSLLQIPCSFSEAIGYPRRCKAIDREYNALVSRQTWPYVLRTPDHNPLPYTWVYRAELLDSEGINFCSITPLTGAFS